MKKSIPTVSVIITCHDLEAYLPEAVSSVSGQLAPVHEVILIHDGCTDAPAYGGDVTTVFRNKPLGVAKARDEGFRLSTGELVLFLDADDVLPETFLRDSLKTIERGADVAYPSWLLWKCWGENPRSNQFLRVPPKLTLELLLQKNRVVATSLQRRWVYQKVGPMDPELPIFEDWAYFLLAMREGFRFVRTDAYLKYRQRDGSRNRQDEETKRRVVRQIRASYEHET